MNLEPINAEFVLETGIIQEAIEEAVKDYVWKQKRAYGIDMPTPEINAWSFKSVIQAYLDSHDEFENENTAADVWLEDEGFELIEKAIYDR